MKGKLGPALWMASGGLLVLIIVILGAASGWFGAPKKPELPPSDPGPNAKNNPSKAAPKAPPALNPGESKETTKMPDPPPPPKAVPNPNRVKENLKKGKTYITQLKGGLHVKAVHTDYGVEKTFFINYAFFARIDRQIEDNDGTTIVELRHFRDLRSVKVDSQLEDVRLDLDSIGDGFLRNVPIAAEISQFSLKPILRLLRSVKLSPEQLLGIDSNGDIPDAKLQELSKLYKAATRIDLLNGKSVRLTYKNGVGVTRIESVKGEITGEEFDYLRASVLVSDSLIVPDVDIKIGTRGTVDGANFGGFVDPSLLARLTGEIVWKRTENQLVGKRECLHLDVIEGTINFEDSNHREGKVGYFRPRGSLFFSPEDQIIVSAKLSGTGDLRRFSKDHFLFQQRIRGEPKLDFRYQCSIADTK